MFVESGAVKASNHAVRAFPMGTVQMCVGNTIEEDDFSPFVADCLRRHACSDAGEMIELFERFEEIPMNETEVLAASGYLSSQREGLVFVVTRTDLHTGEITTSVYQPRCMFILGELVVTPGVREAFSQGKLEVRSLLESHYFGFWGMLDEDDVQCNESAIVDGGRIASRFVNYVWDEKGQQRSPQPDPLWVITEADRSVTTVMWGSEY